MEDLQETLQSILSDPEQMNRITELANSLMGGGDTESRQSETSGPPDLAALGSTRKLPGFDSVMPRFSFTTESPLRP